MPPLFPIDSAHSLNEIAQEDTLKRLEPAAKVFFNSEEGCLDGTRTELLEKIMEWIQGVKTDETPEAASAVLSRIFWLYGLAGSGKSTIANTIASMIQQQGFLLVCFFCKRDDPNRSSVDKILPTLAYQLAQLHPTYRETLVDLLNSTSVSELLQGALSKQAELFFKSALTHADAPVMPHVVIIDALDECEASPSQRAKLVAGIIALASAAPWLKVFVTSRRQQEIYDGFAGAGDICRTLDINTVERIDDDIREYTVSELQKLELNPEAAYVNALVRKAGGLFIWSSTVFRFWNDTWIH